MYRLLRPSAFHLFVAGVFFLCSTVSADEKFDELINAGKYKKAIDYADSKYLKAYLSGGPAPVECTCVYPLLCNCRVGDVNADRVLNVGDAVYVIGYIFKSGSGPTPYRLCSGDANCDCTVNIGDAVYIINYVFKGGPPPCSCPHWLDACGAPLRE